jgi:hypothetical protein
VTPAKIQKTMTRMSNEELRASFNAARESLKKPGSKTLTATRRTYWTAVQKEIRGRVAARAM